MYNAGEKTKMKTIKGKYAFYNEETEKELFKELKKLIIEIFEESSDNTDIWADERFEKFEKVFFKKLSEVLE